MNIKAARFSLQKKYNNNRQQPVAYSAVAD